MSFQDAVRICLQQKYADFTGRARRSEYWFFFLFNFIAQAVAGFLDGLFRIRSVYGGPIQGLVWLALLVPSLAVGVRRLHDTGRSGWWLLIGLIPVIGTIILIVFLATEGQPGDNQYGPTPKQVPAVA